MNLRKLPRSPAIVLGVTSSVTLYAIYYSHFQQVRDKAVMRAGVERDKERILSKKMQREIRDADADNAHDIGGDTKR